MVTTSDPFEVTQREEDGGKGKAKRRKAVPAGPYTVVNPRNIPKDIPVLTVHDVHYYEGDTVEEQGESTAMLVDRGFLVPVKAKKGKEVSGYG